MNAVCRLIPLALLAGPVILMGCDDDSGASPAADMAMAGQPDAAVGPDATGSDAATRDGAMPDAETGDAEAPDAMPPDMAVPRPYPEPGAWPPNRGPGGPAVAFDEDQLYQNCAFVDPGPEDILDHRNLVTMFDGYLLMPWAPDIGRMGGLAFFEFDDPCNPVRVGSTFTELMREPHTIGFAHIGERWWAVTAHQELLRHGGIMFWDITDVTDPRVVSWIRLPGFIMIDAYPRITFSTFWQGQYVYAGGADNGVWITDASDPANPVFAAQYEFEPTLRAGQVQAIGNLLVVTSAEGTRTVLLDISDPTNPQPIPGGDFTNADRNGDPREAYFTNTTNGFVFYARKDSGGGLMIWDIRDPSSPTFSGDVLSEGNGGYVFVKDEFAFVGEGRSAVLYDIADHQAISEVAQFSLVGDLDTITPIGNVAVLAVDDDAIDDEATAVAPWQTTPDMRAPRVTWSWPTEGATGLAVTSRIGLTFSEFVDAKSVWAGSVRLYVADSDPALTRVDGLLNAQENIVNFTPKRPLLPETPYVLEVPAGGVVDFNGNAIEEPFTLRFTTGAAP